MDSIMVVVDKFSKLAKFVACKKTYVVSRVAHLFFQEIVQLHGLPKIITFNHDVKLVSKFWKECENYYTVNHA